MTQLHLLALSLSLELRSQILATLFGYHVTGLVQHNDRRERLVSEAPSSKVLRTCKQVNADTCPILYQHHIHDSTSC